MMEPSLVIQKQFLGFKFGPRFEFYDSPARKRTIFLSERDRKTQHIEVPRLCFLKIFIKERLIDFLVLKPEDEEKLTEKTRLTAFYGPNYHVMSYGGYLRFFPRVCFGSSVSTKIWTGEVDPIEAFWNTAFAKPDFFNVGISSFTPVQLYRKRHLS